MPRLCTRPVPRDPAELTDALGAIIRRLTQRGVTITHTCGLGGDVGRWTTQTCTMLVDLEATAEQQMWLLVDLWMMLTVGPHAMRHGHPHRRLHAVPTQRSR